MKFIHTNINRNGYSGLIIGIALLLGVVIGAMVVLVINTKLPPESTASQEKVNSSMVDASSNVNNNVNNNQQPGKQGHTVNKKQEEQQDEIIPFDEKQIDQADIVIDHAGPQLIGSVTQLSGEIKFNEDRTAHIVPRLGGIVESVSADMGQQVKKGQLLAVISSTQLSELRSELISTQKRKELAQITYEREKKLWQEKISSEQDYLQAQQNLNELTIALKNVSQKLFALGANTSVTSSSALSRYEIRAPFNGMIIEKHIAQGEAVTEDANVFIISDLSTVWAEIIVPAQDLGTVRVGEKAVVKATSMESVAEGKITFVGSLLGEQTRAAKARITLINPNMAWRPGLFVSVDLTSSENKVAVAVQADSIQTINNRPAVFIKVDGGFIPKTVSIGRSDGKYSEITNAASTGINAGTPYAAKGSFIIKAEQGKSEANHEH